MGILKKRRKKRGAILVVVLWLIALMTIIAFPFLLKFSAQYRITEKSFKSLAALNLAEAGVERTIWELNYGDISTWDGDISLRTLTISSFQASDGTIIGDINISITDPKGASLLSRPQAKSLI